MAEIEYAGIKIGGSKMLLMLPLLGTLIGGLWAGFEFYKDYTVMKEKIQTFTTPDLTGIENKVAVFAAENLTIRQTMQQQVKIIEKLADDMYKIEERIDKKITKALDNPLAY
jgi:threonyl-tRNA synthetase|tara:strand:- start:4 stop:339 length:336 start_codon:yes stop_codon:yes gene_type:complete